MTMPPSLKIAHYDGRDGENISQNNHDRGHGDDTTKQFDIGAFQQLRLERLTNIRKAEQLRIQREEERNRLRWNSTFTSPQGTATANSFPLPVDTSSVRGKHGRAQSSSLEIDSLDKSLARRELRSLGKRYASFSSFGGGNPILLERELFPPRQVSSGTPQTQAIDPTSEIDIDTMSYSTPAETLSIHDNAGISVVTPDKKVSSKINNNPGVYGSHYLVLARSNSSPNIASNVNYNRNSTTNEGDDDGSSTASYNTPTPHLQAASACDSNGENDDACEGHQRHQNDASGGTADHFSAFFKAHVLISEMEESEAKQCEAEKEREILTRAHRARMRRIVRFAVRFAMVVIAGATLYYFYWDKFTTWYKLSYTGWPFIGEALSCRVYSWLQSIQAHFKSLEFCLRNLERPVWMNNLFSGEVHSTLYSVQHKLSHPEWSLAKHLFNDAHSLLDSIQTRLQAIEMIRKATSLRMAEGAEETKLFIDGIKNEFYSTLVSGVEQLMLVCDQLTSRLISWAEAVWSTGVTLYKDLTKDVDVLSWTIQNIYRIEKLYYDSRRLIPDTLLELQQFMTLAAKEVKASSAIVGNVTLSLAMSCWQNLDLLHPRHLFYKSEERIIIRRERFTEPIDFYSIDEYHLQAFDNETDVALNSGDYVVSSQVVESSPPFWKQSGTPFVRHPLPSIARQEFHRYIHTIPSYGSRPQSTDSNLSRMYWHPEGKSQDLDKVVSLVRSQLSLYSLRLDSIGVSPDMRKNIAASMIMQKSRPPPQADKSISQQDQSHAMVLKEKKNYYDASYPTQEEQFERDAFDDIDVMSMTSEFVGQVGQLLKRRRPLKKRRRRKANQL